MELIDQLTAEHAALLKLAEEKKQVLIQNDMQRLSQLVKEEPIHLKRIEQLELQRLAQMGTMTMRMDPVMMRATVMVIEMQERARVVMTVTMMSPKMLLTPNLMKNRLRRPNLTLKAG